MKKKLLTFSLLVGLGLLVSVAWAGVTHAANIRSGDSPAVAQNEEVNGSLYIAGQDVQVAGTVKGDLFCAGMNVNVTGTVEGDVICAGQNVRISGLVLGDVRVGAQSVDISAQIGGSVTAGAESFVLASDGSIARDLTVGAATVQLEGKVGRDILGGAERVSVVGTVGRNIDLDVNQLTLAASAVVGGDLSYISRADAEVKEGASVSGTTTRTEPKGDAQPSNTFASQVWGAVFGFIAMLIIGLAALFVTPRGLDAIGRTVRVRLAVSFATGAAVLLVTPLVALVLLISVFGALLGLVLIFVWIAALIAAFVAAAYAVGWLIVEKAQWPARGRRLASLVFGLLVLSVVGLIPLLGGIAVFLAWLCGLGGLTFAIITRLRPTGAAKPVPATKKGNA